MMAFNGLPPRPCRGIGDHLKRNPFGRASRPPAPNRPNPPGRLQVRGRSLARPDEVRDENEASDVMLADGVRTGVVEDLSGMGPADLGDQLRYQAFATDVSVIRLGRLHGWGSNTMRPSHLRLCLFEEAEWHAVSVADLTLDINSNRPLSLVEPGQ